MKKETKPEQTFGKVDFQDLFEKLAREYERRGMNEAAKRIRFGHEDSLSVKQETDADDPDLTQIIFK